MLQEMETDKSGDDEKKKKKGKMFFDVFNVRRKPTAVCGVCPAAPKCGYIEGNEKILVLLEKVKPEIVALRETIITVC